MHGPIANLVADRFTARSVNLLRFDAHLRRRALTVLTKLERELTAEIERVDPLGPTRTAFQQSRIDALRAQTRATIATTYRTMRSDQDRELRDLAEDEATWTQRSVNRTVGTDILTVAVSSNVLKAIVSDTLIEGSPSREWWSRQSRALERRFVDQMRLGMLRGETIQELTQRVRGTKAQGFTDGIMETSRREAEALVRSTVMGVANGARVETYRANDDVVKGMQAIVTLDGRTTEICIARSGAAWDIDGNPLPESTRQEPFPGYPPWHWNCRSTLVPLLKSAAEMMNAVGPRKADRLAELPESTQSSMDGQVAASLTYEGWLKTKSETFQRGVLGAGKWQLWKDGALTLSELIDQSGRPLSLEQLKAAA